MYVVYHSFRLDPASVGMLTCVAFMGAPLIVTEKLVSGTETQLALNAMQQVLVSGVYGGRLKDGRLGSEKVRVTRKQLDGGSSEAWIANSEDLKKIDISDPTKFDLVSSQGHSIVHYLLGAR